MLTGKSELSGRLVLSGAVIAVIFTALEVLEPVFSIGPIGFTTSEIAAGLFIMTAAIWAVHDRKHFFTRHALDIAVLLFLASNFLSILAAEDKPGAFKYTLRLTYAALLYVGISRLPRGRQSGFVVAGAIAATAVLVSTVGVIESFFSNPVSELLSPFKERLITFGAYYNVRVSSTLPFPTIFAFYLEMLTPVTLVFGIWLTLRGKPMEKKRLLGVAVWASLVLILGAIAYSFTRSAYVVTPITLLLGAAVAAFYGYGRRVWSFFVISVLILFCILGVSAIFINTMAYRLGLAEQEQRYDAEYSLVELPSSLHLGEVFPVTVHVKNKGAYPWKTDVEDSTLLIYFWRTYPEMIKQEVDMEPVVVPREIRKGDEADMQIDVSAPDSPGKYVLTFEMFIDAPFSHTGVAPFPVPIEFDKDGRGSTFTVPEPPESFQDVTPPPLSTPRSKLWRAAIDAWRQYPILGMGPDQFRQRYIEFLPGVEPDSRLAAHNIFLEALADTGIVGLAVLIFLLASAAVAQIKIIRRRSSGSGIRLLALGLLVSLSVYVIHGLTEYPLWQTGVTFMLFILLGLTSLLVVESDR